MGKIDDAGDAEDERQTRGDEKQRRSTRQSGEKLNQRLLGMRRVKAEIAKNELIPFSLRPQLLHLVVGRQIYRTVGVVPVEHHALAVLERGLADEGAHRRLVIDRAELDHAEGAVELEAGDRGEKL